MYTTQTVLVSLRMTQSNWAKVSYLRFETLRTQNPVLLRTTAFGIEHGKKLNRVSESKIIVVRNCIQRRMLSTSIGLSCSRAHKHTPDHLATRQRPLFFGVCFKSSRKTVHKVTSCRVLTSHYIVYGT